MNIKKMLTSLSAMVVAVSMICPTASVFGATYSEELQGAYNWAYSKGVTTMNSIDNANMYGAITRAEMAKMLSVYAVEVLGLSEDEARACNFTDIDSVKGDLHDYIIKSCKLGIMGQGITAFRPYDTLSRAEFGTALSRVLWGDKYEGGTPYYANHLNALKAAGIMNQIANAEQTKEVRGYVMLMLQRSEENDIVSSKCDDAAIKLACELDSDECPAECKDNGEENTTDNGKVRSGDLEVTASSSSSKILAKGTSDMDTLTFKSSEEVEITKVILERYGYSTNDDVDEIWLENEEGTVISNVYQGLDSKAQAKLTIKKDYRNVDGTYNATIVLKAKGSAGKTIGFKVVDVDSTAKNLNIDNYKPNQYDMMEYSGATVTMTARGTTKEYNWESGKLYEIAKFKVKAPSDSSIVVKGFTLSLTGVAGKNNVDIRRYIDEVKATVAGEDTSISAEVNKDDQLVVSFKEDVEIAAKENVEFAVTASLSDDFNNYGNVIKLNIAESSDFSALDSKTNSRVTIDSLPTAWPTYTFLGGKSKITNTKLGNVDGAQGSNDIVVAAGDITVTQDIKGTLRVEVKGTAGSAGATGSAYAIQAMRVAIAGDEYEGKYVSNTSNYTTQTFEFPNIEITEGGKIEFRVDIRDTDAFSGKKLTFGLVSNNTFSDFKYVENKDKTVDLAGSISFATLTIQAAKASITNTLTKAVEFKKNEVTRKPVFEGTYTAKKGDLKLNEFTLVGTAVPTANGNVTFYLIVDGDEVADAKLDNTTATSTFTNVEIDAEKSVKVVVEAEVDAKNNWTGSLGKFSLTLKGEDENGNVAGEATKNTAEMKVVEVGAVNVSTETSKKDILRKASNVVVAQFVVKPANGASEVDLDQISFTLSGNYDNGTAAGTPFTPNEVTLTIAGVTEDSTSNSAFEYAPTVTVKEGGVTVKIEINEEALGSVEVTDLKVNNKSQGKEFEKAFYPAVVKVSKMEDLNGTTRYVLSVDKESDVDVRDFTVFYSGGNATGGLVGEFSDGDKFSIAGTKDVVSLIDHVEYYYSVDAGTAGATVIGATSGTCAGAREIVTAATDSGSCAGTGTWDDTLGKCLSGVLATQPTVAATCTGFAGTWTEGSAGGSFAKVTVLKTDLPDYFKIGSNEEDLKVFKL